MTRSPSRTLFAAGRLGKRLQHARIPERLQDAVGELRPGAVAEPRPLLEGVRQQPQPAYQLESFSVVHLCHHLLRGSRHV